MTQETQIPDGVTDEDIKAEALRLLRLMEEQFGEDAEAVVAQLCLDLATAKAALTAARGQAKDEFNYVSEGQKVCIAMDQAQRRFSLHIEEIKHLREERDRLNSHLLDAKELIQRMMKQEAANAELLRLLERHHAESIAENRLHHADDLLYSDTELCRETEAAIKRAKEKV